MHRHGRENLPGSAPPPAPNFLLDETMDDAAFLQVLPVLQSFRWRHAKDPWEAEAVGKCLGVTREAGCGPDGSDGCPRKVNSGPVSSNFSWQQHVSNCFKMLARLLWCRAERFSRCVLPLFAAARLTRVKKNGHSFAGHGQETTSSPLPSEHTGWEELQCNVGNSMTILLGE